VVAAACAGGPARTAPAREVAPALPSAPTASPREAAEALPPPLPPPLPAPEPPPPAAGPSDPLELLWSHRLNFAGGEPLVTIRIMEGQEEIAFRTRGPARAVLRGGDAVPIAAGKRIRVRLRDAAPAAFAWYPLLLEASPEDHAALDAGRRRWEERGVAVRSRVVGGVYGIGGRVVDNRRELLLADGPPADQASARERGDALRASSGDRPGLFAEMTARPSGRLELLAEGGATIGTADALVSVEVEGDGGLVVERVEHQAGPGVTGRADRAYRGRLVLTVDARGKLAAVHAVALEELLRGLVPSEMPASVHSEALKAQAVTARSNVLAQIGQRHVNDPYMLCAEVHCQAYRGEGVHTGRSDAAVRATAGEALFRRKDRTLVDAVYSAMCGGHGEDNDAVWGNAPNPSLRGRSDLVTAAATEWHGDLRADAAVRRFVDARPDAWCARPRARPRDRFRWERRLAPAELDRDAAPLGVGHVTALEVRARGVSGRARSLRVVGEAGQADVTGELRIRRLLGDLPSAMFVVDRDGDALVLRGGGWGHGAGMCQWGAVGRAEAGQDYREILRAYYSGAEVARVY
jgi:SpoIID/LytB domain protein